MGNPVRSLTADDCAKWTGLLIWLIGLVVVVGWLTDIHELKCLWPGQSAIAVNCSLLWSMAGASLFIRCSSTLQRIRRLGQCISGLIILVGMLTLYGGIANQGLAWMVVQANDQAVPIELPGQMLFQESIPLVLIGCAMLLVDVTNKWWRALAKVMVVVALLPSAQALFGYASGNAALFTFCTATECARLHIVVAILNLLFCVSLLSLNRTPSLSQ